tara:strand:+ start:161 stop:460 length:300 start_codon:yes stop_codon:yes gene_type:complete
MSEVKFTDEEINSLKQLQEDYLNVQNKFGQISITRINLGNQLDELDRIEEETGNDFTTIQQKEKTLVDSLTEKYGQGSLDPQSGVFTPNTNTDSNKNSQ